MNTLKRVVPYFEVLALVAMATMTSSCVKNALVSTRDGTSNAGYSKQFGTSGSDIIQAVAFAPSDGLTDGGTVVAGTTYGNLFETNAGMSDVFVIRYDAAGNTLWSRQFGMTSAGSGASGVDTVSAIAYQNGYTYITGTTMGPAFGTYSAASDIFVLKLDSQGKTVWSREFGTIMIENSNGIALDAVGDVYIAGSTQGSLAAANGGADDAFFAKLNGTDGTTKWQKQLANAGYQSLKSIAVDNRNGDVYILGETATPLFESMCGGQDVFVQKYDTSANFIWQRQAGFNSMGGAGPCAAGIEMAWGILLIPKYDQVTIIGDTTGTLFGESQGGNVDVFAISISMNTGYIFNGKQYGGYAMQGAAAGLDSPRAVAYNSLDNTLLIGGITTGNFGGANLGGQDIFVMKTNLNYGVVSYGHYGTGGLEALNGLAFDVTGFMLLGGSTSAGWFSGFLGGPDDAIVYKLPSL